MKIITRNYEVYEYSELSDEAKEKVKQWYLDDYFRQSMFEDMQNEDLKCLFGSDSDLKVQFSLGYCQGDGLNIYGEVKAGDIFKCLENDNGGTQLEKYKNVLTDKEKRTILCYQKECDDIALEMNNRYAYSLADRIDIVDNWHYQLEEYSYFKNINDDVLRKFEILVRNIFSTLCSDYEKEGYKYFYEADDEEVLETCEANEWMFLVDGTYFAE